MGKNPFRKSLYSYVVSQKFKFMIGWLTLKGLYVSMKHIKVNNFTIHHNKNVSVHHNHLNQIHIHWFCWERKIFREWSNLLLSNSLEKELLLFLCMLFFLKPWKYFRHFSCSNFIMSTGFPFHNKDSRFSDKFSIMWSKDISVISVWRRSSSIIFLQRLTKFLRWLSSTFWFFKLIFSIDFDKLLQMNEIECGHSCSIPSKLTSFNSWQALKILLIR